MDSKNKIIKFLAGLFFFNFMSVSNVFAKPGDVLIYFFGKISGEFSGSDDLGPDCDRFDKKVCCKCGKFLKDRCLQLACSDNCWACREKNVPKIGCNVVNNSRRKFDTSPGCECKNKNVFNILATKGYFCFVDFNKFESAYNAFLKADIRKKLFCGYCIVKYLQDEYPIIKSYDGIEQIDKSKIKFEDDDNCAICLSPLLAEKKITYCEKCGKVIHFDCFCSWLKYNNSCPNCKSINSMICSQLKLTLYDDKRHEQNFINLSNLREIEKCSYC